MGQPEQSAANRDLYSPALLAQPTDVYDATFYWPPTDPSCSVLAGAAAVR